MPLVLDPIQSGYNLSKINDNFQRIEDTWDEKLDRVNSGSFYNQMDQLLDMNSNEIINTKVTDDPTSLVTKEYVDSLFNAIDGAEGVVPFLEPRQQGDGVTTLFNSPATGQETAASFFIQIDGITQRPITDFNATSAGKIQFTKAPPLFSDVDITWFEPAVIGEADVSNKSVTATGSTEARTLADRFADVVNVLDFGAVGDGVFDNTTILQDLLSNQVGAEGCAVYFPEGIYNVTGLVFENQRNIKLYGEGFSSVIHNTNTSGSACIKYNQPDLDTRCYGMMIEDLSVTGNAQSGIGIAIETGGWYDTSVREASVTTVNRVRVEDHGLDGITYGGSSSGAGNNCNISNCVVRNNGRSGVRVRNQSNIGSITGCSITSNGQDGVELNQVASTNTVSQNFIADNMRYGVYCFRCEEPIILNNGFNRNQLGSVVLSGDPVSSTKFTEAALIQGNLFGDNGSGGTGREISVYASKGCNIKDNYFYGTGQQVMVYLSDYAQGIVIMGNHFKDLTTEIKVQQKSAAVNTYAVFYDDARAEDNLLQTTYYGKTPQTLLQPSAVLQQTRTSSTDANPMYKVFGSGKTEWSNGVLPADITLSRTGPGTITALAGDGVTGNNIGCGRLELSNNRGATSKSGVTRLFIDTDGDLKAINSSGVIRTLATF